MWASHSICPCVCCVFVCLCNINPSISKNLGHIIHDFSKLTLCSIRLTTCRTIMWNNTSDVAQSPVQSKKQGFPELTSPSSFFRVLSISWSYRCNEYNTSPFSPFLSLVMTMATYPWTGTLYNWCGGYFIWFFGSMSYMEDTFGRKGDTIWMIPWGKKVIWR